MGRIGLNYRKGVKSRPLPTVGKQKNKVRAVQLNVIDPGSNRGRTDPLLEHTGNDTRSSRIATFPPENPKRQQFAIGARDELEKGGSKRWEALPRGGTKTLPGVPLSGVSIGAKR